MTRCSPNHSGPRMVLHVQRWVRTPRGKKIVLILAAVTTLVLINVASSIVLDSRYPVDHSAYDSPMPKLERQILTGVEYHRHQLRLKRLAIFKKIFEKQSRYSGSANQTCRHPHLDLKHDSNKYAFHSMPPLNCTGEALFYLKDSVARVNESVLRGRELGDCFYFGIQRINDDFFTYTESLKKSAPPYDLLLKHDFLRIQCSLKNADKSGEGTGYPNLKRMLMTVDLPHEPHSNTNPNLKSRSNSTERTTQQAHDQLSSNGKNITGVVRFSQERPKAVPTGSVDAISWISRVNAQGEAGATPTQEGSHGMAPDYLGMGYGMEYDNFVGPDWTNVNFDQFLVQVVPRPEVFQRIATITKPAHSSKMNVLVMALDSMSHLSYQRKLPRTYKYFTETLGATVLNGYNIVGDATTAAIIPMFTGKTEMELPEVRKDVEDAHFLDDYPLIWKAFKEAGYTTLYAEDEPTIGTFNLRFTGFKDPPTDHYMRPLWQAIWDSGPRTSSPRYCTGATPHHKQLLNYLRDFFTQYHNVSKFAFGFSGELTHWDNNPGEYTDDDLADLLRFLQVEGHLENTAVVLMGDHGARYSKVRNTVQGKLEERLPLMSLFLPPRFLSRHPEVKAALKRNGRRLTTPFDIHETFLDMLDVRRLSEPLSYGQRGMSVLRDIPDTRTCRSAHIDIHWCACLRQIKVNFDDGFVREAADHVVSYINGLTRHLRHNCTELVLGRIFSAYMLLPDEKVLKFTKSGDPDQRTANFSDSVDLDRTHYQIVVETRPSGALYEVTVEVDFRNETYRYIVTPEISRINLYGDQAKCVESKHPDLRKYCFCRDKQQAPQRSSESVSRGIQSTRRVRPNKSSGAV